MLPNGSSVVQRDVRYQAASLDRRRQDIERRIGDLEDRIAGAARRPNMIEAISRQSPLDRIGRPEVHQFTLSDQQRLSKGGGLKGSGDPSELTEQFKPYERESLRNPLQPRDHQQQINRLYDMVRSTLEGQSSIQNELRQIREDMKHLAHEKRTINLSHGALNEGSPTIKHHQFEGKKSGGSPADRLYSNDYKESITQAVKPTVLNNQLTNAEEEVSTTPFWHQCSRSNADTAHFNKEDPDKDKVFKPLLPKKKAYEKQRISGRAALNQSENIIPKRNVSEKQRTSRRAALNQTEGIIIGKTTPKVANSNTATLRYSPYLQKSSSKKSTRNKTKSVKHTHRPVHLPDPPRGILKYPFYANPLAQATIELPEHLQDLHRVYRDEATDLDRTSGYSEHSLSMRRSGKRRRGIGAVAATRATITESTSHFYAEIQRRLIDSRETYMDADHKNAKHQHTHITNTMELERKLRDDLLHRIHQMRDTKRCK